MIDDWAWWMIQVEKRTKRINKILTNAPPKEKLGKEKRAQLEAEILALKDAANEVFLWVSRN